MYLLQNILSCRHKIKYFKQNLRIFSLSCIKDKISILRSIIIIFYHSGVPCQKKNILNQKYGEWSQEIWRHKCISIMNQNYMKISLCQMYFKNNIYDIISRYFFNHNQFPKYKKINLLLKILRLSRKLAIKKLTMNGWSKF